MITLGLIGLVGGLIAGISPCILPVLPIIFMSSSAAGPGGPEAAATAAHDRTPYLVVAGLATSFSIFTLLGTLALQALPLPGDVIRWAGLVVLVLLGIGMIVPAVERILERPFARLSAGSGGNRRGFVLGLALGTVYVPCAGPVLAAITVAGATGEIGPKTVVLTLAFAIGTSIPLLGFALAGQRIGERITAFRSRQRSLRVAAGVVVIGLALALTFNLTDTIQRAVPDYTSALDKAVHTSAKIRSAFGKPSSAALTTCAESPLDELQDCGGAPAFAGISSWFNTPGNTPLTPSALAGKVVLVDFWAYSCINCQRAITHVEAWYQKYADAGLVVVGVHTPEYAFEHDRGNVEAGAGRLGITYPVALDNDYGTWNNYANESWPAEYLVDAHGEIRHAGIGEGDYATTEKLIRELLTKADPSVELPAASDLPDTTPNEPQSGEMYLGSGRADAYLGKPALTDGTRAFTYPAIDRRASQFSLSGTWTVSPEDLRAGPDAGLRLYFQGQKVYLDVGGTGTVTATVDGTTTTYDVHGAPNIYTVYDGDKTVVKPITFTLSPGLRVYSFTFG